MPQTKGKSKFFLNTKEIAILAIMLAIISLFVFVPIEIAGLKLAFVPLIVIIIAVELFGFKLGVITGLMFGLASLTVNFIRPSSYFSYFFQNPAISIIPRLIIPIVCYLVYRGLKKLGDLLSKKFFDKDNTTQKIVQHDLPNEVDAQPTATEDTITITAEQQSDTLLASQPIEQQLDDKDTHKEKSARNIIKPKKTAREIYDYVANIISAAAAIATNTFGVFALVCIFFIDKTLTFNGVETTISANAVFAAFMANFLVEILICSYVAPTIVFALKKALKIK